MAYNYSPKIINDGLVLYLDAANSRSYPGSGTTWNDLSRGRNNGTLVNGPTFNSANGGSIVFDGVNDYVDCGNTPQLTNILNLTISVWTYQTSVPSIVSPIISRYFNLTFNQGWQILYRTNLKFGFEGRESGSEYLSVQTINTYNINNWYNVVATKFNNTWSIYINGILENTLNLGNGTTPFATNVLDVGRSPSGGFYNVGRVSNTIIYNRALSSTEILQNYNATKSRYGL
jgi:hypothetical protein